MKKILFLTIFFLISVSAFSKEYNQAYEDKLIQDLEGIYTREAVATPDNPTGHPVCATSIVLQAKYDLPYLSEEAKKTVSSLLSRPSLAFYYDSPAGYFRIHYDTAGTNRVYQPYVDSNGNGVPDFVDSCAVILDYIWSIEVDSMGYTPPPSDIWYPIYEDNGGDGKYDIYLQNLGAGILGLATPETTQTISDWSYTSYIKLDNDYVGYPFFHTQFQWLMVTAAHEFFHTIHFGYDAFEGEEVGGYLNPYWMEMSATWMEDQVFDEINDYVYYLPAFFNKPWLSLRTFNGSHEYGSCIWPIFLSEKFKTPDIIKEIWNVCALDKGDNVLAATDQILRGSKYTSTLSDAFREFTVWNYFTADRANPEVMGFYSEGPSFWVSGNAIKVKETDIHYALTSTYPINDSSILSQLPENLGANYIVFEPLIDSLGGLKIFFNGNINADWINSIISYRGIDIPPEDTIFQDGLGIVFDWGRFSEIVMVVARSDFNLSNYTYSYTAEYDDTLGTWVPPAKDIILQNFPNPFIIRDDYSTTKFPLILKEATDVKISVFSSSGELIWLKEWQDKIGSFTPDIFLNHWESIPFKWDGRNMQGEYVASGIYIYQIVTGSSSVIKKMVVVNER